MATVKIFNHHFRTPFLFLLVFELVLLFAFVYVAEYIRFESFQWQPAGVENLENFPARAALFAIVMLTGMVAMGQYQLPTSKKHLLTTTAFRILVSFFLSGLGLVTLYYLLPDIILGRGVLAIALVTSFFGILITRLIFNSSIAGRGLRRRVLVLGGGKLAKHLMGDGDESRQLAPKNASYLVHGFVAMDNEETQVPEQYLVKPGQRLVDYCEDYDIDEVVLAISDRRKQMPVEALLDCKLSNINVIDFVDFWEREQSMVRLDMMHPSWMIFSEGCNQGPLSLMSTRSFDISFSLILLILMFPILLLTAFLIWIESGFRGPIFYKQIRVGFNGKSFELLKFRSMVINAEKDGQAKWADKNDSRVTWVGKFIRKVRIDELPQLINILRGDMSIVGPRPERPEFVADLEKKIPFYAARHRVKPGLAGWAQLKYPYGASESDSYHKLQYDLYYVKNQSLLMDMLVLLQTVEVIVLGKGVR